MPLVMRRVVLRTGVAASATLASAFLARKWWEATSGDAGPSDASVIGEGVPSSAPALRPVATSLRRVDPPVPIGTFPVTMAAPDGVVSTEPVTTLFGRAGTVLNLWATWCAPCRREMPSLTQLGSALAADGIAVVPVSVDQGGVDAVRRYFRANGIAGLPQLADPDGAAERTLGLGAIPVTLVLDRDRRMVGRLDGSADWSASSAAASVRALL